MMEVISLGSVQFNSTEEVGLYVEEEYTWTPVGQQIKYGLAGNPVILENSRTGKPLTIIAKEDGGWITKANLLLLQTLASTPSTNHTLTTREGVVTTARTVRFKRDQNPLDLTPLDTAQRYFIGSIRLIQIEV